ncbi:DUF3014 domain-containing protein [Agaribacter flavus]|uniref:DUF3014 domain-containing protein n=1 Tax=Agaribacter flavus TaxID=1902781 RepID=A0ABV7FUP3_9ALTE
MSEQPSQLAQMKPHLIAAGILAAILVVVLLWPKPEQPAVTASTPNIEIETTQEPQEIVEPESTNTEPTETFDPLPSTQEVVIGEQTQNEPTIAPPVIEEELPEPKTQIDVSDTEVKSRLAQTTRLPAFARLLVSEALIQKFVINVSNLARAEASPKDALVVPPKQAFRVYSQANRKWIDPASFQRYSPYIDVLESMDINKLLALFETYRPVIEERYAEISRPGASFDDALIDAIDTLLDTPQVPVPIEVYTDSVMYKFKDEQLESLSAPQKQLMRMGPDNMRRLKAVLRDIKAKLQ